MTAMATLQIDLEETSPEEGPVAVALLLRRVLPRLAQPHDLETLRRHVDEDTATLQVAARLARETAADIDSANDGKPIPLEDALTTMLLRAEVTVARTGESHRGLVAELRTSQRLDAGLRGDLSERVSRESDALRELAGALQALRWAIMEHNADCEEPLPETFNNAADLIASLKR